MMNATQWEYRAVDTVISGFRDQNKQFAHFMEMMNEMGLEGWELVTDSVIHTAGYNGTQFPVLLFKRPRTSD